MENLIFSLNAALPIFLIMVIGYLLRIFKLVDEAFIKTLNSFNYKISLPILLFKDISEADFFEVWDTLYVLFCLLTTLACITVIWIAAGAFYKNKNHLGEFVQASYRGSAAVLGIAFVQNIYGHSNIAPLMIIGTVPLYNIAAVLVLSFTGPKSQGLTADTLKKSLREISANPIILGILAGIIFSVLPFQLPVLAAKTVDNLAVLATPLALLGLGGGFEGRKALAEIKPTLVCTLIKLFLQPAVFLPLAVYMGFRSEQMVTLLIMLGAPTTVSCYIMAKNMKHEGVLTSSVVVATTFLSSLSLTFWLYLLKSFGII